MCCTELRRERRQLKECHMHSHAVSRKPRNTAAFSLPVISRRPVQYNVTENAANCNRVMYKYVWKAAGGFTVGHTTAILAFVGSQQYVDGKVFLFNFLDCLKWVFDNLSCTQYAILTVLEPGVLFGHKTAHKADSGVDLYMLLTLCSLIVFCRDHV